MNKGYAAIENNLAALTEMPVLE